VDLTGTEGDAGGDQAAAANVSTETKSDFIRGRIIANSTAYDSCQNLTEIGLRKIRLLKFQKNNSKYISILI